MSFWVYILRCADGKYYTGHTDNLEKRMHEHASGEGDPTFVSARWPADLVFSQEFGTRVEALSAERQIKGWSRAKKEAMMKGNWDEVVRLAKSRMQK